MTTVRKPFFLRFLRFLPLIAAMGLFLCSSLSVSAQEARPVGPKKVVLLEGLQVEGKIEKPEIFLLLTRHRIEFERLKLKKSFLKEIMESVRRNPF